MDIKYGEIVSYLDVANKIQQPEAVRAVAIANGQNGIAVFIPCDRVVGSDGTLTGYGGGLSIKKKLLKLEKAKLNESRSKKITEFI